MKIICVGRNYTKHIDELQNEKPTEPVLFCKPDSAVLPKNHPFYIPEFSDEIHYEVEILVKINRLGKHIDTSFANRYYNEIGLGIDFTARDLQDKLKDKGLPWEKAKAFDNSAVISKFVPVEQYKNINNIHFSLYKNDILVQEATTSQMLWKIDELIAYISTFMTLKIGDIIFTGTPAGVGKVNINDKLTGKLENKTMFEVNVK